MLLIVLSISLLTAWLAAAFMLRNDVDQVRFKIWAAAGIPVILLAAVTVSIHIDDDGRDGRGPGSEVLAWPATTPRLPSSNPATRPVARSVESLIGPLEARLARAPDDASGWALLAQSYAYIGDDEAAEQAVAKAVALGFDEQALRDDVQAAGRTRRGHALRIRQAGGG